MYNFRLLEIDLESFVINYVKTDLLPCSVLEFSSGNLYTGHKDLYSFSLKTMTNTHVYKFSSIATKIVCENDYCCVVLRNNEAFVFKNSKILFALPVVNSVITAVGFGAKHNLFVVTENNALHGYNLKTQENDNFTSKYSGRLPKNFLKEVNRTIGIMKYLAHGLILYTHYSFTYIDLKKKPPKTSEILTKDRFPEHKNT